MPARRTLYRNVDSDEYEFERQFLIEFRDLIADSLPTCVRSFVFPTSNYSKLARSYLSVRVSGFNPEIFIRLDDMNIKCELTCSNKKKIAMFDLNDPKSIELAEEWIVNKLQRHNLRRKDAAR